jgi:hypothetical protein
MLLGSIFCRREGRSECLCSTFGARPTQLIRKTRARKVRQTVSESGTRAIGLAQNRRLRNLMFLDLWCKHVWTAPRPGLLSI